MAVPYTVFLDRDGVFNEDPHQAGRWPPQVRSKESFRWLAGVQEAFARLNREDIQTCLVTNQPGTAVGLSTPGMIHRLHAWLQAELAAAGGRLDRVQVCFAPPGWPSRRRKPRPGMLEDGARSFAAFDRQRAVMIGDKPRDAGAAAAFGIPCVLLATSMSDEELTERLAAASIPVAAIVADLPAAVDWILATLDA